MGTRAPSSWRFDGATRLEVDANGDLLLQSAEGRDIVRQHKPVVYQYVDVRRQPIEVGYIVEHDGHVKLWIADYDPRVSLVIDPVLDYATYVGGSGVNGANAIAVDADGNAYVVGTTSSADFPLKNPLQPTLESDSSAFIAKLNHDGSGLVYATYLGGGNGSQEATAVALDESGHAFVTGYTTATNFPVTPGAFQVALGGNRDAFIAKVSASGDALMYASDLGGRHYDSGYGIALDRRGDAYVTGSTGSGDFPFTPGAFQRGRNDSSFGTFVAKVSTDGHALVYAAFLDDSDDLADGLTEQRDHRGAATGCRAGRRRTRALPGERTQVSVYATAARCDRHLEGVALTTLGWIR